MFAATGQRARRHDAPSGRAAGGRGRRRARRGARFAHRLLAGPRAGHPARARAAGRGDRRWSTRGSCPRRASATCCSAPTILVILAVGQAIVIITRNVDLSVGSILGLVAFATGKLFVAAPGAPIVARRPGRGRAGRGLRRGQRRADRRGPGAGAGGHARHAVRLPRHRLLVGRRASRSTPPTCRARSCASAPRTVLGVPVLALIALVVVLVARVLPARRTAAAASCTRSAPTRRRPAVRHPGRPAGVRRVRGQRRAGRAGRRAVRGPLRHPRRHRRHRPGAQVVAAVVVGGVAIFGGSGTVYGAALGALLLTTIGSALAVLRHRPVLAAGRGRRADPRRHRPGPGLVAPGWPAGCRKEGPRCLTSDLDRRAGAARPTRRPAVAAGRAGSWDAVVVVALVVVVLVASALVDGFATGRNCRLPAAGRRADRAHRAADDAGHHHRRDRPVGGQHARPDQRGDGPAVAERPAAAS